LSVAQERCRLLVLRWLWLLSGHDWLGRQKSLRRYLGGGVLLVGHLLPKAELLQQLQLVLIEV
jgi:hypothetical protein